MKLIKLLKEFKQEIIEDYPTSFDMDYFKELKSFKERIQYCQTHLKRLSSGSSRIVYQIDDEKVLKLAKNQKGLAQNEAEIDFSDDYYVEGIVARTFEHHPDNKWVEMELAQKLTKSKFKSIVGVNFEEYALAIKYHDSEINPKRFSIRKPDNFQDMWENEFISSMFDFMANYDIPPGDLQRLSTYGVVKRDGQDTVVMIDYGLTRGVLDTYYS